MAEVKQELLNGQQGALLERCLLGSTLSKFNVSVSQKDILFPYYDDERDLVAIKRRTPDKQMPWAGSPAKAGLFGQQLWNPGGRAITITEGEIDCLSAFQMQGSKYPTVSIRNGAQGAASECRKHWEYLNSFEKIVISFDGDKAGRTAARDVAELFTGKAYIVSLDDGMDANDYLVKNREAEYKSAWWDAAQFKPDGIVSGSELLEAVVQPLPPPDVCYPWRDMNEKTSGAYYGQLITICAGSGVGKTQFTREILHHIHSTTDLKQGALFLEESVVHTALGQMSFAAGKNLSRPKIYFNDEGGYDGMEQPDTEELRKAFEGTLSDGRLYLYQHFGSTGVDNLVSRMRYMATALGCRVLWLDHISIVVSGSDNGDERKALDEIMTKLATLAQETNTLIFCVSHLKRPDGKGHEEGAATSLAQLRGSGAIGQLSHMSFGLERNGQNPDEYEANTTTVRVLKNRRTGDLGVACRLYYDKVTGRMTIAEETDEEGL